MRFNFIEKVCENCVVKPKESKERIRSEKIDRILTGKYTAIPCFIGIMLAVFYLTFNVIGAGLQKLLEMGIDALTVQVGKLLTAANVNVVVKSLVMDGIFAGVGSVLSFLPIIVTLFFSCRSWKTADTSPELHLSWISCSGRLDFPARV